MFSLDQLKSKSPVPLLQHFLVFLRCVKGRRAELSRPKRHAAVQLGQVNILLELVDNNMLVIIGVSERPYVVLFEAVVDVYEVRIHRVRVK